MTSFSTLLAGIKKKNKSSLAQAITMVENGKVPLSKIFSLPLNKKTRRIGITGPPGVGKSTLISYYTKYLRKKRRSVGILVVDPSSSITGGALLGDRVRMGDISGEKRVFIRSLASRGTLGGLSKATYAILRLYELWGFDDIIIETVGAGQSEVDITNIADTTVLVLIPQLGDEIQALKAGIMEMIHVIAINRAEQSSAQNTLRMLYNALSLNDRKDLILVELKNRFDSGLEDLDQAITHHHKEVMENFSEYEVRRATHEAKVLAITQCAEALDAVKLGKSKFALSLKKKLLAGIKKGL